MADSNGRTTVIVALIGLVGTIAAAALANWDKIFPPPTSPLPQSAQGENQDVQSSPQNLVKKRPQIELQDEPEIKIKTPTDSGQKSLIWRSQSNLTRITNLNQICFGTSTLSSVQTVFGYDKPTFTGTITIPFPKMEGCRTGDTLQGNFELYGNAGNCVGTIKITWQNNNNAFIKWNISNLGSSCPVGTKYWEINTYPVPT
ncbi:MAG: hypothetical protein QNJ55_16980 [Xenococcus sp. MO_188.B8]|nr:hypothetical protein [Xenococcus sp. MO_188.B8]